jgi:hypothetical protein
MTNTPRWALPELTEGQATPETRVNGNTRWLEAGAGALSFKNRTTNQAEPGSPADGDCYLLVGTPTGTHWSGQGGKIALFINTAWEFKTPKKGMVAYVVSEDAFIGYNNSSAWVTLSAGAITVDNDTTLAGDSASNVPSQHAVKSYVDGKVAGLSWKQAVRAATTANGTLASAYENGDTIDGVTLATGDRILIKNQTTASENGIYTVNASGAPTRATDADSGAELVNATVYVSEGTTNADTQWTCTTNATITVGSTSLAFAQLTSGGGGPTVDNDTTLAGDSTTNVPSQHAVKSYVDGKVAGLSWKQAVRAATTANGTLASAYENGDTIDGVTLATGDRILIKNQTTASENGIYTVNASGAPTRATDADSGAELVNATVYVSEGTTNADTQWTCTTNATITVGTTSLTFAQLTSGGGGSYSGGVQSISILAAAMRPRATNGPSLATTETTTNKVNLDTLDFDPTTAQYAQIAIAMPKSWDEGTVTAQFLWTSPGGTGNVVWGCQAVAISDDDVLDAAFGTAQTVTDGVTATTDIMESAFTSAITIGGTPAEGDLVVFQFYRDASNGSDTSTVNSKLIAVRLNFTTNAADDS